ncbi:hypothetical protein [Bradyrhizobium japonicum]|uniref:hypothetical protein n=1 Tax=Bradyrhizobium japonicum TaxID=375 RepID=UPI0004B23676|nr:hypothetical protein [Bradyrhizobium japonicum]
MLVAISVFERRLRNVVLPDIPMFTTPVYVLHAFGRPPLRARLFIDFLVEALGVSRNLSL